jgi:colanic acid/amylovoran biosynthesis glycosyltransferase
MTDSLLLVLPLPAFQVNNRVYLDDQACYGLDLWLENFSNVVLACPTQICDQPPIGTKPIENIQSANRLTFEALPFGYTPKSCLINLSSVARRLAKLIDGAKHLQFAIGGFWGDWGAFAAIIASRKQRPFAVWTDRVESSVMAFQSSTLHGPKKLYYKLNSRLAFLLERAVIRRSSVGLFNGMDCYRAYAAFCANPQLVANFNYAKGTHISDTELATRLAGSAGRALKFVYVGRAHKDKGIFDWIEALAIVNGNYSATWFGDGPELDRARTIVAERHLDGKIDFAGNAPHNEILKQMKTFDAFIFCHKTQESPRCLVEALACGLPILGYSSDYAKQLIEENSGGLLSPINDIEALAATVQGMIEDVARLKGLSRAAALDGRRYDSETTFRHRSDLIKLIPAPDGDYGWAAKTSETAS